MSTQKGDKMDKLNKVLVEINKARDKASANYIKALSRYGAKDDRTMKFYEYYMGLADACRIVLEEIDLDMNEDILA